MGDVFELIVLMARCELMRVFGFLFGDSVTNHILYRLKMKKKANFIEPQTFSEKLQVLKMYYDNPLVPVCVDKYHVRKYVEMCGLADILKENYAVYTNPDDIDLSIMPEKFFVQMSHMSKFNYVIDKHDTKKIERVKKIYKILKHYNHYWLLREKAYKNVSPRVICCEYLQEPGRSDLTDYKFYCFDGEVKYFMVSYGELHHDVKNMKFDLEWNNLDEKFKGKSVLDKASITPPKNFERMVEIAKILSQKFPHVRIDLYNIDGAIFFGEMTFFSSGGFVHILSDEMDREIASWIDLEKYKCDMNY